MKTRPEGIGFPSGHQNDEEDYYNIFSFGIDGLFGKQ